MCGLKDKLPSGDIGFVNAELYKKSLKINRFEKKLKKILKKNAELKK